MSKYKIGDKVKIKEDLIIFGSDSFIKHISKFKGKEVTIEEVNNKTNSYKMEEEKQCDWTDEMIEGLVKDTKRN